MDVDVNLRMFDHILPVNQLANQKKQANPKMINP